MSGIKIIQLSPGQWQRYREIMLNRFAKSRRHLVIVRGYGAEASRLLAGAISRSSAGRKSWLLFAQEGERLIE
jgi:hypothetical protein